MPNKNKFLRKSQAEDLFPLLIAIGIALFLFFYLSVGYYSQNDIIKEVVSSQVIIRDSDQQLINYLKTPVKSDKFPDSDIADLIISYYFNKNDDTLNQLKLSSDEFLSKSSLETDYSSWSVNIIYSDKELKIESEKSRKFLGSSLKTTDEQKISDKSQGQQVFLGRPNDKPTFVLKKELTKTIIPAYYTGQPIEVKLFIVTTKQFVS